MLCGQQGLGNTEGRVHGGWTAPNCFQVHTIALISSLGKLGCHLSTERLSLRCEARQSLSCFPSCGMWVDGKGTLRPLTLEGTRLSRVTWEKNQGELRG